MYFDWSYISNMDFSDGYVDLNNSSIGLFLNTDSVNPLNPKHEPIKTIIKKVLNSLINDDFIHRLVSIINAT